MVIANKVVIQKKDSQIPEPPKYRIFWISDAIVFWTHIGSVFKTILENQTRNAQRSYKPDQSVWNSISSVI